MKFNVVKVLSAAEPEVIVKIRTLLDNGSDQELRDYLEKYLNALEKREVESAVHQTTSAQSSFDKRIEQIMDDHYMEGEPIGYFKSKGGKLEAVLSYDENSPAEKYSFEVLVDGRGSSSNFFDNLTEFKRYFEKVYPLNKSDAYQLSILYPAWIKPGVDLKLDRAILSDTEQDQSCEDCEHEDATEIEAAYVPSEFEWFRFVGAKCKNIPYADAIICLSPRDLIGISTVVDYQGNSRVIIPTYKKDYITLSKDIVTLIKARCRPFTGDVNRVTAAKAVNDRIEFESVQGGLVVEFFPNGTYTFKVIDRKYGGSDHILPNGKEQQAKTLLMQGLKKICDQFDQQVVALVNSVDNLKQQSSTIVVESDGNTSVAAILGKLSGFVDNQMELYDQIEQGKFNFNKEKSRILDIIERGDSAINQAGLDVKRRYEKLKSAAVKSLHYLEDASILAGSVKVGDSVDKAFPALVKGVKSQKHGSYDMFDVQSLNYQYDKFKGVIKLSGPIDFYLKFEGPTLAAKYF